MGMPGAAGGPAAPRSPPAGQGSRRVPAGRQGCWRCSQLMPAAARGWCKRGLGLVFFSCPFFPFSLSAQPRLLLSFSAHRFLIVRLRLTEQGEQLGCCQWEGSLGGHTSSPLCLLPALLHLVLGFPLAPGQLPMALQPQKNPRAMLLLINLS